MTVFVLVKFDYEETHIAGVYASLERAQSAAGKQKNSKPYEWVEKHAGVWESTKGNWSVERHEVIT